MLNNQIAKNVIDYAMFHGADFCELFVEKSKFQIINVLDSKVNSINSGIDSGIGVRILYGTKALYGYTNSFQEKDLIEVVKKLVANDTKKQILTALPLHAFEVQNIHPTLLSLSSTSVETEEKIRFLMKIDEAARKVSPKISQVNGLTNLKEQKIEIFNSEGLFATDTRHYTRLVASVYAKDGTNQQSSFDGPGALMGWDFAAGVDPEKMAINVAKRAVDKLSAADCPSGKMPVIIDNGFGGVIFHEACGHLLETTSVAKKSSVFHDKMGEQIAHSAVSAVDDGLIQNAWGSINIDDEGMPTQRTQLIKDGILTSFMVDKVGAMKTGFDRTGSGRRQSYKFAPTSRMRNTYIEAGPYELEDLIASVDHGIYCKKMGGGSVDPGTGEFNFSADESYLIENGKVTKLLKAATLIGTGPQTLSKISMVANNLDLATGMCGSSSGSVPVTVGQAALKVDEILVGGQK